nr:hypothetical protein [Tanacetum cinerariifolium]
MSGVGIGVKKKSLNRNSMNTSLRIDVSTKSDDTMNEDTPVGVASAVHECVTPSAVDMTVKMKKISSLNDTTALGSFPPLSMQVNTTAGTAPVLGSSSCKVFGHNHVECPKNTGAGETKNMKKTSQASKGILVGPKVGFKTTKEYRLVAKNILLTQAGESKLNNNEATSSGSSFWNVKNSSPCTTSIMDKIGMFEDLNFDGQGIFVDEVGNPLKNVEYLSEHDSEDEVASTDNDRLVLWLSKRLDLALKVCWNNGWILMEMVTMMKTRTMMICLKARISLKNFKLYVISWISEFE